MEVRRRRVSNGLRSVSVAAAVITLGLTACTGAGGEDEEPSAAETTTLSPALRPATTSEEPPPDATQQKAIDKVVAMSDQSSSASEVEIRKSLGAAGFSEEVADYAIESSGVSFHANAVRAAEHYAGGFSVGRDEVADYLTNSRNFTQEQAESVAEDYSPAG